MALHIINVNTINNLLIYLTGHNAKYFNHVSILIEIGDDLNNIAECIMNVINDPDFMKQLKNKNTQYSLMDIINELYPDPYYERPPIHFGHVNTAKIYFKSIGRFFNCVSDIFIRYALTHCLFYSFYDQSIFNDIKPALYAHYKCEDLNEEITSMCDIDELEPRLAEYSLNINDIRLSIFEPFINEIYLSGTYYFNLDSIWDTVGNKLIFIVVEYAEKIRNHYVTNDSSIVNDSKDFLSFLYRLGSCYIIQGEKYDLDEYILILIKLIGSFVDKN